MSKIRIGVIGAGWWATSAHIPAIQSHPHAELVAVQSRERAKAEKIARDFGAKNACTSVKEMLAPAAFIVSPENSFTTGFTFDLTGGRATY